MTSTAYINLVTDAIISRLNTNKTALGNFLSVKERDQEPSVLADHPDLLPVVVVMPLANRADSISITTGGTEIQHKFSLSISGYYLFNDLDDDIRTMRGYAYTCFDLFRTATGRQISYAQCTGGSVNPGYFVLTDKPIYKWIVTLNLNMMEPSL